MKMNAKEAGLYSKLVCSIGCVDVHYSLESFDIIIS